MPAAHLKPKRQPITNEMLGQMLSELDRDHKPSHDRLMLKAAITLGFFSLLRVSEFTVPNQHGFNPDQHLTAKDITMQKLASEVLHLRFAVVKLVTTRNKAAVVERLYLHLQDPSSKPEPEHEDMPDATPESEDSSKSSSEGSITESTPYIFNQFASALHWIIATNYAAYLIHYLDDFFLSGPPGQPTCSESTETMLRVCERLGIPVAWDKHGRSSDHHQILAGKAHDHEIGPSVTDG
ncbi:hypothetical protein EMCRGX_G005051 [Ephydatia muelleri]